jgi:hypothetical protein
MVLGEGKKPSGEEVSVRLLLLALVADQGQTNTHPPLPRAILFRHSSLNYREFKTKNWWEQVPATSIRSILNPFKLLA